jgi:phosphoribosylformylglycinamidine synthase
MNLWHLVIQPDPREPDREAARVMAEAAQLHLPGPWNIRSERGFLIQGQISQDELQSAARRILIDPVVDQAAILHLPHQPATADSAGRTQIYVMPRPGVTDPEAESARDLLHDLGYAVDRVRSIRGYSIQNPAQPGALDRLVHRVLSNQAVEQVVIGPLRIDHLEAGHSYSFHLVRVPLGGMNDQELERVSREGQLALSLPEMREIQRHFQLLGREPTDCELETIAQTWSEHCSHKTLKGRIRIQDSRGNSSINRSYDNLLKETIFGATQQLMQEHDWMVSVFVDNAGVVRFDAEHDVCFKVETHNHPSAIDPYGGSNTGLGGVIRDVLGTGLAARPVASTDIFCVAPPDTAPESIPPGILHPRRILEGVVAGVRDYGNRMGIPTVNGAVVSHPAFLANPLVFCGTIGVLPHGKAVKRVEEGDLIVAIGGRTGRDGIHGATFSSLELTSESESLSSGSVQIGNAITEKKVCDAILRARDRDLFHAITDCGAGGFSSAVGEMGEPLGAQVDLDRAPLKYPGLSYTDIWISEAQERMILAVPPDKWPEFKAICQQEQVESFILGEFVPTGRLMLRYQGHVVCDLEMHFLHHGRPPVLRHAEISPAPLAAPLPVSKPDYSADLLAVLHDWNTASKEWIIRQYDHEVQGQTIIKPLIGAEELGPSDAAVICPVPGSFRGLAIGCGIAPRIGTLDAYNMAAAVIDEAIRNLVAVGADPDRIALLDNFCWGNPERPQTLGSLVLAAEACRDFSLAYHTPFISGKDSLYNEYSHQGVKISIPPTLLISSIGIVPDVRKAVTMDLKEPGNLLLILGSTQAELGGSIWAEVSGLPASSPPRAPDAVAARRRYQALHAAIQAGLVRACHDLSDGGLAAAVAEMALAGNLGASIDLALVPFDGALNADPILLFAETPGRLLLEIRPGDLAAIEAVFRRCDSVLPVRVGSVSDARDPLVITGLGGRPVVRLSVAALKQAWLRSIADVPAAAG